jgi:hypothetical protein
MALPKKGWRKITVADVSYAWTIKFESPWLYVRIMLSDGSGRRLSAWFDEDRVVTPQVIRFLITSALQDEWKPTEPNKDFIVDGDKLVQGTEFELNHPPDCNWTH